MATSTPPTQNVDSGLGSLKSPTGRLRRVPPTTGPSQRSAAPRQRRAVRHFLRHLGEMYLAMMVGMMVFGAMGAGVLAAAGTSVSEMKHSAPEVFALGMAFNMTVGMTVWMRHRRHSWAMCAEMAGAMFVPAFLAIVLLWCSVIHGGAVGRVEMNAMLPAMVAVMLLRRVEYSQPVHAPAQEAEG